MMERLKAYYRDANIDTNIYEAVLAVSPNSPLDFHNRIEALNEFTKSANSKSLIEANKRIDNTSILNKVDLVDDEFVNEITKDFSKKINGDVLLLSTLDKNSVSKLKAKLLSYVS